MIDHYTVHTAQSSNNRISYLSTYDDDDDDDSDDDSDDDDDGGDDDDDGDDIQLIYLLL